MDKSGYMAVREQLSFEKPLWVTLLVIAADIALLCLAFWLVRMDSLGAFLLAQPLFTLFYFHNFALLHEAGHGNVHPKRWVNTLIGHYASLFCFMPYFPWKFIHQEHHVWAGNVDKDPTMKNLKTMRQTQHVNPVGRVAWRSWVPLPALAQHFVFWFYPLAMREAGKMTKKALLQSCFSIGLLAVFYISILHFFPAWVSFHNLGISLIFYLMMTELVNLPHHVMVPTFRTSEKRAKLHPWEQHITTRSCHYPYFLSEVLTLNFNLHTEHHFFPNLPWYRLRTLQRHLKSSLAQEYNEVYGLNWNLTNRSKDLRDLMLTEIPHPLL